MGVTSVLRRASLLLVLGVVVSVIFISSCSSPNKETGRDEGEKMPGGFHADNDIAMTVKSLVDAIKVGEAIDSVDYDFTGVLTDGQGSPLYTNLQGLPGDWVVDVIDTGNVTIKNLDLGDLLTDELESYLLGCLKLDKSAKIELTTKDAIENDDTEVRIYDFGGGYLRFETRSALAPNGLEGPLLTIVVSTNLPKGVERQTSV